MKRWFVCLLLIVLLLTGCGSQSSRSGETVSLSFQKATDISAIKALNGQTVTITGYMATLSPINGKYIYLMNLPYQSCPFCVPNTTVLSNTMAVYAKSGSTFEYTDQAVRITGKMEVSDTVDDFGYTYNYRIVDAECQIVDLADLSGEYALWYAIAEDGLVGDINAMFDYLYFLCRWTDYTSAYTDENGERVEFYLYAGDVERYLEDDGPYGYASYRAESYFPNLIARVNAISATELTDLVGIIEMAQAAEQYALGQLNDKKYVYDEATDRYILDEYEELGKQFQTPWNLFCEWLARWEM